MTTQLGHEAHDIINALNRLAHKIDEDYAEACLDTVMSMEKPTTPAQRLVFEMQAVAFMLNAVADDLGEVPIEFVDYRNV